MQSFEDELDRTGNHGRRAIGTDKCSNGGFQSWHLGQQRHVFRGADVFAGLHDAITIECLDDLAEILDRHVLTEDRKNRALEDHVDDLTLTAILDGFDLEFAGG